MAPEHQLQEMAPEHQLQELAPEHQLQENGRTLVPLIKNSISFNNIFNL